MLNDKKDKSRQTKKSSRVLIIIENMSYTYDTRVRKIAASLIENDWEVAVICPKYAGDPNVLESGKLKVYFYPAMHFIPGIVGHILEYILGFTMTAALSIFEYFRRGFDVIHICNPPDIFFPLGGLFRMLGCKFIFDQHDLCPELWDIRYGSKLPFLQKLLYAAEYATLKTASQVFITSETSRLRILKRGKLAEERVTLVRNGPDMEKFPEPSWIIPKDKKVFEVGYVGDMNPQDGIDNIIATAQLLHDTLKRTDIKFVLIGDGSVYQHSIDQIKQLKLEDTVTFLGRLPPSDAMPRLAQCDVCILPDPKNPFNDSCLMVKSLEYMALGKPFVTFDLEETQRACGEVAQYAENGNIESLAREIIKLVDNPDLRIKLGQLGRKRVEQSLSWSKTRMPLLETYARFAKK